MSQKVGQASDSATGSKVAPSHARASLLIIERRLKSSDGRARYIEPRELARAIELNPGVPLSPAITEYLCRTLRGEIPKPKGRRPADELIKIRDGLAIFHYLKYKTWLQRRQLGLNFKTLETADWWTGPPHERAARMTCRMLQRVRLPMCDYRHIINLASQTK